jgi:hypothetical protein
MIAPQRLVDAIRHSHVNRRYGFHLVADGRYQDKIRPETLKTHVEEWLLPHDDGVSQRMLYRLVRGFFMVPAELARQSDAGSALQCADRHPPKKWDCFGDKAEYLTRLADGPKDLEGREEWLDQQRRAVAVFRAFCGKPTSPLLKRERGIVGDAYGDTFEAFRDAVMNYYLVKGQFVNICALPPLFSKYEPSPAEDARATLSKDTYEVEGDGSSAFQAAPSARFNRSTGKFEVHGSFCPPSYGSSIAFTRLDVFMARPDDHRVQVSGLSKSETGGLSGGYRAYRTDEGYAMRLSGKSTDDIDNLLRDGFHVMTLRNAAKPFSVRYRATTPLADIKIDVDTTNANMLGQPRTRSSLPT